MAGSTCVTTGFMESASVAVMSRTFFPGTSRIQLLLLDAGGDLLFMDNLGSMGSLPGHSPAHAAQSCSSLIW